MCVFFFLINKLIVSHGSPKTQEEKINSGDPFSKSDLIFFVSPVFMT